MSLFGNLLPSALGFGQPQDDWNQRPNITSQTVIYNIPDDATPEKIIEMKNRVAEYMKLRTMSKAEQLEYFMSNRFG